MFFSTSSHGYTNNGDLNECARPSSNDILVVANLINFAPNHVVFISDLESAHVSVSLLCTLESQTIIPKCQSFESIKFWVQLGLVAAKQKKRVLQ